MPDSDTAGDMEARPARCWACDDKTGLILFTGYVGSPPKQLFRCRRPPWREAGH